VSAATERQRSSCIKGREPATTLPASNSGVRFVPAIFTAVLSAQTLSFDAASIRKSTAVPGEERSSPRILTTPTGVTVRQSNLRDCIQWAWSLREYQLTGPDWITFERYDIAARAGAATSPDNLRAMMRSLLADRFQLRLRRENKEMPVYALVPGRAASKLTASAHPEQTMARLPGGGLRLEFRRTSLAELANFLSTLAAVARPVVDQSGLDGLYDFRLDLHEVTGPWASDAERQAAPSIATVIQEQLGLRLESRRQSIEIFAVDRVERPSEN
jgi:uncharacterized protein (TIGR03435 family)